MKSILPFLATVFVSVTLSVSLTTWMSQDDFERLGATILSTASSDTLSTFRTNVNTSLTNLNNAISGGSTGMLAMFSNSTTLIATGTPTAASYYATSTTEASFFPYATTTSLTVNGQTFIGGTTTITTTNAATSTLIVGCIRTYATSTETPIRLSFGNGVGASSAATTTFGTGVSRGLVTWSFGTCPL